MALKRPMAVEENETAFQVPAARNKFRRLITTVFEERNTAHLIQEVTPLLESMIRRIIQEALDRGIHRFLRPSLDQTGCSGSSPFQLQFHCSLPSTLFTNSSIVSDQDKSPMRVVLYDSVTKNVVQSGPLSSVKVSLVALDGDFCGHDREDWSKEEFDKKIVHNRDGKRPLVTGELIVSLKDGVGCVGNVSFTDNSSWIRGRKFRLGAKAQIGADQLRIREGLTNAFTVKDHRGELYKKNYPPSLDDNVWRLERIGKDGASHKKLSDSNIFTVQDFLRMYNIDKILLRKVLKVSNKKWETIIEHAKTCPLDGKKYLGRTGHGFGLVFDSIHRVIGVTFDGHSLHPLEHLDPYQMSQVEDMKQLAYKSFKDWISFDDPFSFSHPMPLTSSGPDELDPNQFEFPDNQDDPETSDLYNCEVEQSHFTFRNLSEESSHQRHTFNSTFGNMDDS